MKKILLPFDFEANAKDGQGVDWPVSYSDIAPWYDYVEEYIGVSGQNEGLEQLPDGQFLKPMELNCVEEHLKKTLDQDFDGRALTIGRAAHLTERHNERGPCQYRNMCETGCPFSGYFSSVSVTLPAAQKTGNMTFKPHAIVHSIIYDEKNGKAKGVRVINAETKETTEYFARVIFLCASTLPSTQIMLNSTSEHFPNGIGNSSGTLGRHLMDHYSIESRAMIAGFEDGYYNGHRPNGIYIPRFQNLKDKEEDLKPRAPIVTVMGHVDHGKTSLLDYIRKENVIAGESGGITQHIGAYGVELDNGQKIAFLDTPGHEAFTAMRARGAQVTDLAIIVVAADDDIMPQTKEAIAHAQAASVPIIFAINKIDKPDANPEKIKEGLAQMNLLVEDWGGKIQSHDISAKTGTGIKELLEKVLLEAELLELKANPDKPANGTVVEAFLDKGRGYISTILVQAGTLRVGDYVLAGKNSGKVKAMQDERGNNVVEAGPSTPVSILGLDGAPQAGDKFNVFQDEREAKQIAAKRSQLQREQSVRTQRHITLDEIGRRIALGDFQELNIILKGDVDGSVEALTDSFQKLSTEEIQVNIIHKGVGAITESDVLLATASDAIIEEGLAMFEAAVADAVAERVIH